LQDTQPSFGYSGPLNVEPVGIGQCSDARQQVVVQRLEAMQSHAGKSCAAINPHVGEAWRQLAPTMVESGTHQSAIPQH
jgi:hypothetical protein